MRYTLRQLQVFLAVARWQSVSRAADELAMSQSAASGALAELERQFELQLFDRVGKRLQLNDLGRALRPEAEALMARAARLQDTLRQRAAVGQVRLGATLTIGNYLAVEMMARYMRENPGAEVRLQVANTAEIARRVANFELDLGLVEGELQHPELRVTPWLEDELVAFCAPGHPLAAKRVLGDAELLSARWIVRESGSGTRQGFDRAMHGLLPALDIALELQHTEAIARAVEAGLGVGCLSQVTVRDAFDRGSLVPLAVPGRDFRRHFYLVLHRQKFISEGIRRWLQLCEGMAAPP